VVAAEPVEVGLEGSGYGNDTVLAGVTVELEGATGTEGLMVVVPRASSAELSRRRR